MYTDEKRPDGEVVEVYEVVSVLEADQPKPRRAVWRRLLRVFLSLTLVSMLWSTLVPMTMSCGRHSKSGARIHKPNHIATKPKQHFTFPSDLSDFIIKQESQSTLPTLTSVYGKVVVGSCPKAENISVYFDIHVSDDSLWDKIKIEPKEDGIVFSADAMSIVRQSVNVTAFVVVPAKEEFKLKTFQVETRELNIKLAPSFKTMVNGTYFETISGNISSYGKDSMDILLSPYLSAKSASGSIFGRFGLGKFLELESGSGMIAANVTSAPFPGVPAKLLTKTVSGNTYLTYAGKLHARPVHSTHKSVSGNVKVHYPEEWQGKAKLSTFTGDLSAYGEGVKIVKKKNTLKEKLFKIIKGSGDSTAYIGTVSGDIVLAVGKCEKKD